MQDSVISLLTNLLCRKIERTHQLLPLIFGDVCTAVHETAINEHDGWLACYHGEAFKSVLEVDLHPDEGLLKADALIVLIACYLLDVDAAMDDGGGGLRNHKHVVALGCQSNSDARNGFSFTAARSSCEADFANIRRGSLSRFGACLLVLKIGPLLEVWQPDSKIPHGSTEEAGGSQGLPFLLMLHLALVRLLIFVDRRELTLDDTFLGLCQLSENTTIKHTLKKLDLKITK